MQCLAIKPEQTYTYLMQVFTRFKLEVRKMFEWLVQIWQLIAGAFFGFITSFFASSLFWRNLLLKKPCIEISKYVLKYRPAFHKYRMTHAIRIINIGKRDIINIKFNLRFRKFMSDGTRITISYPLLRDNVFYLAPQKKDFKESFWDITFDMERKEFLSKMQNIFSTAKEFRNLTEQALSIQQLLKYFDYLELLVAGTDGNSNVTKVFSQKYGVSKVIAGKYELGNLEFI
tara:strand:- start:333 stop:1022 length:690 start_codon:yes stop_codon:yes gene_type:complete